MIRPTDRQIRIAAALVLAAGLAAGGVAIFSEQLGLGADAVRGTFGWRRISLLVAGALIAALGALLVARPQILSRPENWERIEPYVRFRPSERQLHGLAIGLLALLGLVLVWTRLANISESLWHDEAHTILNYSAVGPGPTLFGEGEYSINNHPLYNLLSWATAGVLGESEAVYRAWSVLPAIAAVAAGAWWAWRRLGPITAVAFAALAIAAPLHLELAPQARGYGLALLAATLMLIAADHLVRAYSGRTLLGFLGAGVVGIWTLHVFAVAFVAQALALLKWPNLRRPVVGVVALAAVLSAVFYAPVLRDVLAESRPRGETISLGAALLLEPPLEWVAVPILTLPLDVEAARWMSLAALALVGLAIVALWRRGDAGLALILVTPPLVFNLFITVAGLGTVPRHQFILLTHVLILVAVGIAELGGLLARSRRLRPVAVVVAVLAALALSKAALDREQGRLPLEDVKQAASVVRGADIHPVVTDSIRTDGLRYYLGGDLHEVRPEAIEALLCERRQPFVYVRQIAVPPLAEDYREPASLGCVREEDSLRIRVSQRGRGGAIDVWIINAAMSRETIEDDLPYAPDQWLERAWD